jgi:hypothetical protein
VFLPIELQGLQVMIPVDAYTWKSQKPPMLKSYGLGYRYAKDLDARIPDNPSLRWGEIVQGVDEGDGWLRVRIKKETKLPPPLVKPKASPRQEEETGHAQLAQLTPYVVDGKGEEYAFSKSVWDVALFVGQPAMGITSSALAVFSILLVIFSVMLFAGIALDDLVDSDVYNSTGRQQLQEWRTAANQDPNSLVTKLCSLDVSVTSSAEQLRLIRELHGYVAVEGGAGTVREHLFSGGALSLLVLGFWFSKILGELAGVLRFLHALFQMRNDAAGTVLEPEGGIVRLRSLDGNRIALGCFLGLTRFCLCGFLSAVGTSFILHTVSMQNIVLNYVALATVLDIDKLLYESLAPVQARKLINRVRSVPLRPLGKFLNCDIIAILAPICLLTAIILVAIISLVPFVDDLQNTHDILCH